MSRHASSSFASRPSELPRPRNLPHVPALDGARGIAVGLVLAYHFEVPGVRGGFLGVDLFFVLSGFLITTLLVGESSATGRIDLVHFWYRRGRRLLPALFLLLGVIAIWATTIDPVEKGTVRWDLLASLGYVVNWRFIVTGQSYFAEFVNASPVRHLWSLAIEEQFYMVWPIVVGAAAFVVSRWRRWGRRAILTVLVASAVGSILLMAVTFDAADASLAYYSTFARAHELLIGAIAALVIASRHPVRSVIERQAAPLASLGLAAVVGCAVLVGDTDSIYYLGGSAIFSIAAAVLIASLVVARDAQGPAHRLLAFAPLAWLGAVSYGVYLWHWPLVVWLTPGLDGPALVVVRLGATLAIASASFYALERPIRRGRIGRVALRPSIAFAAAGVCILLLASGTVLATRGWQPVPEALREEVALQVAPLPSVDRVTSVGPASSVGPAGSRGGTVGIVGDSIARSLYPGFAAAGADRGLKVVSAALAGCAIGDSLRIEEGAINARAKRCVKDAPGLQEELVRTHDPDVIVWYSGRDRYDILAGDRVLAAGSLAWRDVVFADWDRTLGRLRAGGAEVRLLLPFFNEGSDPERCTDQAALGRDDCTKPLQNGALRMVYREWAARHPADVSLVDIAARLCHADPCPATLDGIDLRRGDDIIHFSLEGATLVAGWLLDS